MRLWARFVWTLALGPVLWWIGTGYLASQQGATIAAWLARTPKELGQVYLVYTLPAVLLCVALALVDRLLRLLSLDLATVLVSPLLGWLFAWLLARGAASIPVELVRGAVEGATPLFVAYGLVWGLTIREPADDAPRRRSDGEFIDAMLPR